MSRGEVLVAIMNNRADWAIACNHHWYRIPIEQVEKLKKQTSWPPRWLAFYQTKVFDQEAHTITYYAEVVSISEVYRWELFPDEVISPKRDKRYCKLELTPIHTLTQPIKSDRLRRITFIATTWEKLIFAQEINDL